MYGPYYGSRSHYERCLTDPLLSSAVFGTIFAGVDVAQGARFTPARAASYAGGIWVYNALQCPMEDIHGRESLLHNVAAGGILGYVGVSSGRLGIPFVDAMTFYRHPWLRPQVAAIAVYGGMAGAMAGLGGKRI